MRLTSIDALVVWLSGVIEAMDPCNNDRAQGLVDGFKTVLEVIESAEPIEAEPVKHGKWKLHDDGSGTCDQCHHRQKNVWDDDNWQNYCGVCGAKMGLEE